MSSAALPPDFSLRRANVADAGILSALAKRTFVETFGHLYPRAELEAYLAQTYTAANYESMLTDPAQAIWLLEHAGEPAGHAEAGPCKLPHPDVAPGDGELRRLYVLNTMQGRGLGAHLMQAALDWLLKDGARTLWLGVWSENFGAQRFYARYGFQHAGEYQFVVGAVRDHELIFKRPACKDANHASAILKASFSST